MSLKAISPRFSPKTCTCGVTFLGGTTAKYCPACRAERTRQRDREKYQRKKAGTARSLGSADICAICGKQYTVRGGNQKYCSECSVAEDKRRKNKSWLREYYGNPEKRQQLLERARQWAEENRGRMAEILHRNYEKTKDTRNEKRRKRTGYKLRPLGRTEICPKCGISFTVTERNQRYCDKCRQKRLD